MPPAVSRLHRIGFRDSRQFMGFTEHASVQLSETESIEFVTWTGIE